MSNLHTSYNSRLVLVAKFTRSERKINTSRVVLSFFFRRESSPSGSNQPRMPSVAAWSACVCWVGFIESVLKIEDRRQLGTWTVYFKYAAALSIRVIRASWPRTDGRTSEHPLTQRLHLCWIWLVGEVWVSVWASGGRRQSESLVLIRATPVQQDLIVL